MAKSKQIKKSAPADGGMKGKAGEKRKFRYKAGTVALREVKKYQKKMVLPTQILIQGQIEDASE